MKKLLVDTLPIAYQLLESEVGGPLRLRGTFQKSDTKNANGRIYGRNIWEKTLNRSDVVESINKKRMVGEVDHPNESEPKLKHASHIITELKLREDGVVEGELQILPTEYGKHLESLLRSGVEVGVSSRGMGSTYNKDGIEYIGKDYELLTFDVVASPSTLGAYPKLVESKSNTVEPEEITTMSEKFQILKESAGRLLSTKLSKMSLTERKRFITDSETLIEGLDRISQEDPGFRSLSSNITSQLQERTKLLTSPSAPPSLEEQLDAAYSTIEEMAKQMSLRERKMLRTAVSSNKSVRERAALSSSRVAKLVKENKKLRRENEAAMIGGDELLRILKSKVRESNEKNKIREERSNRLKTLLEARNPKKEKKSPLIERLMKKGNVVFRGASERLDESRNIRNASRTSEDIASQMIRTIGGI